jgi:hypothetical protein
MRKSDIHKSHYYVGKTGSFDASSTSTMMMGPTVLNGRTRSGAGTASWSIIAGTPYSTLSGTSGPEGLAGSRGARDPAPAE